MRFIIDALYNRGIGVSILQQMTHAGWLLLWRYSPLRKAKKPLRASLLIQLNRNVTH
ncbi:hypothetical protein [Fluviicola sp.]|uniref:hypothetical protein n=1 Tax=Fluviicola sp. TaxID=1917219 RepID=UPI00260CB867|nr:hypothetical protein [Fluviicola sp.]